MNKKPVAQKMVTWSLSTDLWNRLREYQFAHRIDSLTAAGRAVLDAGLRACEPSVELPAPSESAPERSGEMAASGAGTATWTVNYAELMDENE